ncbi:MAG TPA: DUF2007 domain-containing protein, partial [Anaerolineales bacterium]|nr:DUF2007 domain-containing protein [Anaerolineales bacterium]
HPSICGLEAYPNWYAPISCERSMDCIIYSVLEIKMDELKYDLLTELTNRMQADLLESFLEANGIDVELFQESVGHSIYPVTIDLLGRVQVFVPKDKIEQAKILLEEFNAEE